MTNIPASPTTPCTAFADHQLFASGTLQEVAAQVRRAAESGQVGPISIYDDTSGRIIDLDLSNATPSGMTPGPSATEAVSASEAPRGPGRPKLGVIAREITLLPRHWEWLSTQPGGASVALRKLDEQARRTSGDKDRTRAAQEAAYHFIASIAGNLPGFEEATRALFAYDRRRFADLIAGWPTDLCAHAIKLAFADLDPASADTTQPETQR